MWFGVQQLRDSAAELDISDLRLADQSVHIADLTRQLAQQRETAQFQAAEIAVNTRIISRAVKRIDTLRAAVYHAFFAPPDDSGRVLAQSLSQELTELRQTILGLPDLESDSD